VGPLFSPPSNEDQNPPPLICLGRTRFFFFWDGRFLQRTRPVGSPSLKSFFCGLVSCSLLTERFSLFSGSGLVPDKFLVSMYRDARWSSSSLFVLTRPSASFCLGKSSLKLYLLPFLTAPLPDLLSFLSRRLSPPHFSSLYPVKKPLPPFFPGHHWNDTGDSEVGLRPNSGFDCPSVAPSLFPPGRRLDSSTRASLAHPY